MWQAFVHVSALLFLVLNAGGRPMADLAGTSAAWQRRLRSWWRHDAQDWRVELRMLCGAAVHRHRAQGGVSLGQGWVAQTLGSWPPEVDWLPSPSPPSPTKKTWCM